MIMALLKESTREYHDRLESNPFSNRILQEEITIEEYRKVLERFYGFYHPVEASLIQALDGSFQEIDFHTRRKVPLLEKDLIALGHRQESIRRLTRCSDTPELTNQHYAFGILYVLEGATLGGQIISRHLSKKLALTPETGSAFFSSYQNQVGARWQSFKNMLNSFPIDAEQERRVLAGAIATFTALDSWFLAALSEPAQQP